MGSVINNVWSEPVSRIRGHWRGELSPRLVFIDCPVLAIAILAFYAVMVWAAMTAGFDIRPYRFIWPLQLFLVVATSFAAWWVIGTFRTAHRLLSRNQLFIPALLYLLAVPAAMETSMEMVPFVYKELTHGIQVEQAHRAFLAKQDRHNKGLDRAWSVLAIPELKRISASGDIGWNSAKILEAVIKENPGIRLLELDSLGGVVHERELIIEVVRKYQLDTLVLNKCASACTAIFLAGERRFITADSEFRFHRSGYFGRQKTDEWSPTEYMTSIFYRERGVDEDFAFNVLNTPYQGIWRPPGG